MQINRENYSSYSKMIQQMFGGTNTTPDPYGTDYGNYALRFTPTNRPFNAPNWNEIKTKSSKPAMSEKEFDTAIRELARKEFSSDKKDHGAIQKLVKQFQEVASPDRKAIYEESMRKTGGKMNAACMFYDSKGNQSFTWHPLTGRWSTFATDGERSRAQEFYSIYNDELKRLNAEYGEQSRGRISIDTIHQDLGETTPAANGKLNIRI